MSTIEAVAGGVGDRYIREGPAIGAKVGTVGEYSGGLGKVGVLGFGAGTDFAIGSSTTLISADCSSGNTVTPGGGEGGGIDGNCMESAFDDLHKVSCLSFFIPYQLSEDILDT